MDRVSLAPEILFLSLQDVQLPKKRKQNQAALGPPGESPSSLQSILSLQVREDFPHGMRLVQMTPNLRKLYWLSRLLRERGLGINIRSWQVKGRGLVLRDCFLQSDVSVTARV